MSCKTDLNIGCIGICDKVILPMVAETTGQYKLIWSNSRGAKGLRKQSLREGENFYILAEWFMPYSQNTIRVLNQNGMEEQIKFFKEGANEYYRTITLKTEYREEISEECKLEDLLRAKECFNISKC